jgi:hypothetical protein
VLARRRIPDDLVLRYCALADALAEQSLVRV